MATIILTCSNWSAGQLRITYENSNGALKITEVEGRRTDGYRSYDLDLKSITVNVDGTSKTVSLSNGIDFNTSWQAWGATDNTWASSLITYGSITVTMPSTSVAFGSQKFTGTLAVSAGGGVVNSITDNCDNTLCVVATMGADGIGDINKVTDLSMWGFINRDTGDPGYSDNGEGVTFDLHPTYFTVVKREGRTITYRLDLGEKLPTTSYMVRLRAYSLTPRGNNPGGTSVNSGKVPIYNFITLLANGGIFKDETNSKKLSVLKDTTRFWSVGGYLPNKDRAEFKGYYTEPTGGVQVYDSEGSAVGDGTYFKGSGSSATWQYGADVTLYAQWKGNQVKLKKNGQWVDCNAYVKYNSRFVSFNMNKNN